MKKSTSSTSLTRCRRRRSNRTTAASADTPTLAEEKTMLGFTALRHRRVLITNKNIFNVLTKFNKMYEID